MDPTPGAMGPAFGGNSEFYYKPLIMKVQITVEGVLNQLYAHGMLLYQYWEEIVNEFWHKSGAELSSIDISTYFQSQ